MAQRFWTGGNGTWNSSSTTNWSTTSGGAGGASVPTSSDDVIFDTLSNATSYSVSLGSTVSCNSITFSAPLTGNISFDQLSNSLNVYGSFTLYSGMTYGTYGSVVFFASTTGKTITTAGNWSSGTGMAVYFQGVGGGWQLQDDLTCFYILHQAGTLDTNGKSVSTPQWVGSGNIARTLTLGASNITILDYQFDYSGTNQTINPGTSTITKNNSSVAASNFFDGGGKTWNNVVISTDNVYIKGANTFNNFTKTGIASKTDYIFITANQTVTGTFLINGNSSVNRVLIQSDILNTPRTITAATVGACSNVDFMDIIGAGAGSWNLSAITGGAGQCGGNGGITFTTAQNQYWRQTVTGSANWSDTSKWFLATGGTGGAGRAPLPQDTAFFDANSFTVAACQVAQDMPRVGSVNWTGATNNPTWNWNAISGPSIPFTTFGSITLISAMNPSLLWGYNNLILGGRGNYTITTAGNVWSVTRLFLACPGGTYTQQDNFVAGAGAGGGTCQFNPVIGTWNSNGFNTTFDGVDGTYAYGGISSGTATLTMGTGTWTIVANDSTFPSASTWRIPTGMTINSGTSTIVLNDSTSNAKTFYGGGKTYYNLTLGGSGTGAFTLDTSYSYFTGSTLVNCSGIATVNLGGTIFTVLNFTGFSGVFAGNQPLGIYGNITLSATLTSTFTGRFDVYNSCTFTSNGISLMNAGMTLYGGTLLLADNFFLFYVSFLAGTFNANNKNLTLSYFITGGSGFKTVTMGSGTWSLYGGGITFWDATGSNLTINAGTSTIYHTNFGANVSTFNGGGKTYYKLQNSSNATHTMVIAGNNTFSFLNNTSSAPVTTTKFTSGSTQTITSASGWQMSGTAGNINTLASTTNGAFWNIVCASGTINADYMSLQDSHASGGATFNAGSHSTNVSGNTGWIFSNMANNFFIMFQ